jgi:hypothetical protein
MTKTKESALSRRWLLKFVPTTVFATAALTAVTTKAVGAEALPREPDVKDAKHYLLLVTSLVPYAPKLKASAIVEAKPGQRIPMRQYLDLPIQVMVEPDEDHDNSAAIRILSEKGIQIAKMNISNRGSATFVNQRIQVDFSVLD